MIKVIYNKVCGRCVQSEPLTSGMVGQPIEFEYSADFDGLTLTAVFTNGKTTVDVLNPGNQCVIPHEVLDTVGTLVKVGIYAVRGNELVIPTVYAHIGVVQKGADPSGDVSIDPTLPVWAQIQGIIGNLNDLDTEAKNNLVAAINEAAQSGGGGGSTVELDTTLSEAGKAADAKAVGDALAGKQDTISDLEAIRTGAAKGATALQSVPSTYRTASEQDTIDSGKVDKVTGKGLSSNDYTDAAKAKVDALAPVATSGNYNDLTNKPTIPTVLPNPHKLTINGTEYDGSTDVQMTIEGGGSSVPKPLTYDYMPEGYPSKAMGTLTLLEAQELAFVLNNGIYGAPIASAFKVVEGQTYTVNWDGTEYECIGSVFNDSMLFFGNGSIMGGGNDTGEPFCYAYLKTAAKGMFGTLDTSASHIISVKKTGEIVTPMAEEFLPAVVGTTAFISYDSDSGAYGSELTYDELYERLLGGKQVVLHKTVEKEYRYLTKWKKDSSGRIDLAFAGEVDYSVSLYTGGTIGGAP